MLRNRHLSRAISDLGLYELRRQLEYKGIWNDCQIIMADRFFASSKTCSDCGEINQALTLSDREWACVACGCVHDRDLNAAGNLEHWGVDALLAASSAESQNARGGEGSGSDLGHCETNPGEAGIRHEIGAEGGPLFFAPGIDFGRF